MAPHWSQEGRDLVWRPNVAGERAGGRRARLEGTGGEGGGAGTSSSLCSAAQPDRLLYSVS